MAFKYIGEAVALLGIAYSIVRWIERNADESDARSHTLLNVDLARLGGSRERSFSEPESDAGATGEAPDPASPPDPAMLDGAAVMFGLTREEIVRMEPRERALMLSGYRAAREAQRRSGSSPDGHPS